MFDLLTLLKTHTGRICVSILWGLALSMFFKKTCVGNKCIVITGPPLEEVRSAVYTFGDPTKCYRFTPVVKRCDQEAHSA